MPHVTLVHEEEIAEVPIAGRSVRAHWAATLAEAGLRRVEGGGTHPLIVVDARFVAVRPSGLRALAATVAQDGLGGVLRTHSGRTVAVAVPEGEPEAGERLLHTGSGEVVTASPQEAWRIDDLWERAHAERAVVNEVLRRLASVGVRLIDPTRIWVEPGVRVAPGAVLWPDVTLLGQTRLGPKVQIHPGSWLRDTVVGEGSVIKPHSVLDGAVVGSQCSVGPMAHLRPQTVLAQDVKVGNFVEVKNATLHSGVRASHLSYLGDAEVGEATNVGAGTITCNYDGFAKHRTTIGAGAFIGSNTALVAPIEVGDGAIVGAGSTVTRSIPADALVVERAEERVFPEKAPRINERNRRRAKEAKQDG